MFEIINSIKGCVGCLFWLMVLSVLFTVGYFVLNIFLYLLPFLLTLVIGGAVLYGLGHIVVSLIKGK